ncbi:hypothetical protein CRM22_008315 [Opisthorchis felineus]|uniref:Cadherin domain-containing protein n=1 Tax=Opisthorchis felineus TaxID=147828 RepID=A0A4S2LC91_OPIFE|nr:hypothetical protein CRM22_008315 [Opisthorchis felineus]
MINSFVMRPRWSSLFYLTSGSTEIHHCDTLMWASGVTCWCFLLNLWRFTHPVCGTTSRPPSEMISVSFSLPEETRIGAKVGNIFLNMNRNPQPPLFASSGQLLELKPNRYLMLNGSTGDLFVRSRIDRESLCTEIGTCCSAPSLMNEESHSTSVSSHTHLQTDHQTIFTNCVIRMLVLQSPVSSDIMEVLVYILDINDNAPSWPYMVLELDVPEHVAPGTVYKIPEARDADQGPTNTVVAYRLFSAEYNRESSKLKCPSCSQMGTNENTYVRTAFALDSQLVHSSPANELKFDLQLRVEEELDRERQSTYYYILFAVDGKENYRIQGNWISNQESYDRSSVGQAQYTGTLTIKINILDVNDHAPTFVDPKPVIMLAENTKPGTVIYQMSATDVDTSDQNSLLYRISSLAKPEVHRCFQINSVTGEISLKQRLNRHNASLLSVNPFKGKELQMSDSMQRGDSSLGYVIPVLVTDKIHQAEATLQIQLLQVNMHAPVISITSHLKMSPSGAHLWVSEGTPVESIIAMINIDDPDKPFQSGSRYGGAYSGKPECFTNQDDFSIQNLVPQTLTEFKLLLMQPLDREKKDKFALRIECWDGGSPPLSSETTLDISVEDVDDSSPVFDRSLYTGMVKETVAPNTPIIQVRATDADIGANAEIFYRIVGQTFTSVPSPSSMLSWNEEKHFLSINSKTGEIYSEMAFDREIISSINCTVEAVGAKYLEMLSGDLRQGQSMVEPLSFRAVTQVVITIEDVNDVRPHFNTSAYEFSIAEGQLPHTKIGQVFAIDLDAEPPNNLIHYSMRSVPGPIGQVAKKYITVSQNGVIYTHTTKLDREQTPVLTFQVVATDSGNPPLSASVSVLLRVLDVNDNSPVWLFPIPFDTSSVINVSQHATIGFQLAQLRATDPDEGPNGEVNYAILHGNEDEFFEVDSVGGALYLIKSLYRFPYNETEKRILPRVRNHSELTLSLRQQKWVPPHAESVYIHKLVVKVSDRGNPSLSNTTVLYIAIYPARLSESMDDDIGQHSGQVQQRNVHFAPHRFDHDLVVMIVLIALTSLISLVLILAICLVRCKHVQTVQRSLQIRTGLQTISETDRTKQSIFRSWWSAPVRAIFGRQQSLERDHREVCSKPDGSEVHGLQHISSSPSKLAIPATYTTGSPNNTSGNADKDTYFTIHPCTWNSNRVGCNLDRYPTLAPTVDPAGNTFMVEVSPDLIESTYSVLRAKPFSGHEPVKTEYQSLCLHQICQLHNPTEDPAGPCELYPHPKEKTSSGRVFGTSDVYNRMSEIVEAQSLLLDRTSTHCETCRRPVLKTFSSNEQRCSKNRDANERNQCTGDETGS